MEWNPSASTFECRLNCLLIEKRRGPRPFTSPLLNPMYSTLTPPRPLDFLPLMRLILYPQHETDRVRSRSRRQGGSICINQIGIHHRHGRDPTPSENNCKRHGRAILLLSWSCQDSSQKLLIMYSVRGVDQIRVFMVGGIASVDTL